VSILDSGRIAWNAVLGSRQVTDIYLLALAVQQGGRLVTLDRAVPLQAVPEARSRHLVVI
jgi:predicted nucleic acid-binding protein